MYPTDGTVTSALVHAARDGDASAVDQLFELAYHELLHRARVARRANNNPTVSTTGLLHEAYVRLQPSDGLDIADANHFRNIVVRAMRQVLVDMARKRSAAKRGGGGAFVTLHDGDAVVTAAPDDLIALDEALTRLADIDARKARVVEYRFYGGLDVEETASALGVSAPTVKRDWRVARAWLAQELDTDLGA